MMPKLTDHIEVGKAPVKLETEEDAGFTGKFGRYIFYVTGLLVTIGVTVIFWQPVSETITRVLTLGKNKMMSYFTKNQEVLNEQPIIDGDNAHNGNDGHDEPPIRQPTPRNACQSLHTMIVSSPPGSAASKRFGFKPKTRLAKVTASEGNNNDAVQEGQ